jgi:hypothetical protein
MEKKEMIQKACNKYFKEYGHNSSRPDKRLCRIIEDGNELLIVLANLNGILAEYKIESNGKLITISLSKEFIAWTKSSNIK